MPEHEQTASQTVGPFFHIALVRDGDNNLLGPEAQGERLWIRGRVLDGDGQPIPDALLEVWQADAAGRFNHPSDPERALADPHFKGFGRSGTDAHGAYWFRTVKPGTRGGQPTPHINLRLFARGMLIHAVTRLYFEDEPGNASDPVLEGLDASRRGTLIASREDGPDGLTYRFDVHMQGPQETVFFDV